jgi:hypothetical protein
VNRYFKKYSAPAMQSTRPGQTRCRCRRLPALQHAPASTTTGPSQSQRKFCRSITRGGIIDLLKINNSVYQHDSDQKAGTFQILFHQCFIIFNETNFETNLFLDRI